MSGDFEPEQKRYLEGFMAGLQIAKTSRSAPGNGVGATQANAVAAEPVGPDAAALRAQDRQTTTTTVRTYHDTKHNDDLEWNSREDQAYSAYNKENHRKTVEFSKLRPADQQTYWGWRHEHSDTVLKIDVK